MEQTSRRSTDRPPWAWRLIIDAMRWFLRRVLIWRVRIRKPEIVPRPGQPLVVVLNHTSALDAFIVADAVWRHLRCWSQPLVKAELFEVPLLRLLVPHTGAIPVVRTEGAGRETAYDAAVERLRQGGTVLVAPEGTTTHDGSLLPLRHGAARLALDAGVDVLVVTHFGAQRGFSPVVRFPERGVLVTMTMDVLTPRADEDASSLTGRIAATMIDRSRQLRDSYAQADPGARWWPPYSSPASPTATARENLERYRHSMAEAVAHARERMSEIAEGHEIEQRVTQARERALAAAEDLAARSRERAEMLAEQTRVRVEGIAEQTRERMGDLATQAREAATAGENGPTGDASPAESPAGTDPDPPAPTEGDPPAPTEGDPENT